MRNTERKPLKRVLAGNRLFLVNLSLISLIAGSLLTSTLSFSGCGNDRATLFAAGENTAVNADREALQAAMLTQRAFRNIAKSIGPAVVSINATVETTAANPYNELFGDDFFQFFFGEPRRGPRQPRPQQRQTPTLGSGFVINDKGYILTNFHVVKQASQIKVIFADGREFEAKVVGNDPETDIALLKIEPSGTIPAVSLGNSDEIEVGDWAIAIGNPFNLPGTFTVGVVSAKSRGEQVGAPFQNFIQTDTAINPGNSGGPLVNIRGEVIGINTMIYTRTGGSLGIGFSVPINIAKRIVEALLTKGSFERGYLGIFPAPLDENMRKALKVPGKGGVIVNSVIENGPAAAAGLKEGDVILEINGSEIENVPQLMRIVADVQVGQAARLKVWRGGKALPLSVKVGKRPSEETIAQPQAPQEREWLGIKAGDIASVPPQARNNWQIGPNDRGIVVLAVTGPAQAAGLMQGDLIISINNETIGGLADFTTFIGGKGKTEESFVFRVRRQGRNMFVAINK